MKNDMEDDIFNASADKVVELLLDAGKTFTPHIVTQILRKTGAYVGHQQVREYFDVADEQGWSDFDYSVVHAYVNGSPAKSRVYFLEGDDSYFRDSITMDIEDFQKEIDAFLAWFHDTYEYQEDSKNDWSIKAGDNPTITMPADHQRVWYISNPVSTISISGTINKDSGFLTSGSTDVSSLSKGTTTYYTSRNAGWDNHKTMKRGPDGKWIKQ